MVPALDKNKGLSEAQSFRRRKMSHASFKSCLRALIWRGPGEMTGEGPDTSPELETRALRRLLASVAEPVGVSLAKRCALGNWKDIIPEDADDKMKRVEKLLPVVYMADETKLAAQYGAKTEIVKAIARVLKLPGVHCLG